MGLFLSTVVHLLFCFDPLQLDPDRKQWNSAYCWGSDSGGTNATGTI
jgi:hypothetical protein